MKLKLLIFVCIAIAISFLLAVKYGYLTCSNISGSDGFESITPNACVDMMELGFHSDVTDACVAYSNKCDSKGDVYHSPVVASEVTNLYGVLGKDPTKGSAFITAFQTDACMNPIACSSDADCPSFLKCTEGGGACQ